MRRERRQDRRITQQLAWHLRTSSHVCRSYVTCVGVLIEYLLPIGRSLLRSVWFVVSTVSRLASVCSFEF